MNGILDAQHGADIVHIVHSQEGKHATGQLVLAKQTHVLRQLDTLRQPLGCLVHCPIVHLRSKPRLPQLLNTYVQIIVVMECFVAFLIARFVF